MHGAALAASAIWRCHTPVLSRRAMPLELGQAPTADRSRHNQPTKLAASANVRDSALIHANGIPPYSYDGISTIWKLIHQVENHHNEKSTMTESQVPRL